MQEFICKWRFQYRFNDGYLLVLQVKGVQFKNVVVSIEQLKV